MKKFFTVLSIICLIPGVVGIIMSLFINLYDHEKVIILVCGILAMVFIIIADPGILKPKKDANYNCWLDEEYDDDEEYYEDYDEDDDDVGKKMMTKTMVITIITMTMKMKDTTTMTMMTNMKTTGKSDS